MTILIPLALSAAVTAIFLWREKQLLQRSVSHLTDAIAPGDWLRRNAQRQRDGRCEFQTPTKTEGTALRSSVREPHAVANASSEREVLGIDQSVNGTTSNSFNAKEVVNNTTPKRAESGARDLQRTEWEKLNPFPHGRFTSRN